MARTGFAMLAAVLLAPVTIGLSACGSDDRPSAGTPPKLQAAYDRCVPSDAAETLSLGDNGSTLLVDTHSKSGSLDGLACVLDDIGTPDYVIASIDRTTALMGVQKERDGDLEYSWAYHPDNGIDMVIKDLSRG
jgi:hypothetical protein